MVYKKKVIGVRSSFRSLIFGIVWCRHQANNLSTILSQWFTSLFAVVYGSKSVTFSKLIARFLRIKEISCNKTRLSNEIGDELFVFNIKLWFNCTSFIF